MTNYDITAIEDAFKAIVKAAGVTTTVYSNRPKSAVKAKDFAVVSVLSKVNDRACFAESYLEISLFAQDNANEKNGKKLSYMYGLLIGAMPGIVAGRYIVDPNPVILPDVSDDYGFHARIIQFNLIISAQ